MKTITQQWSHVDWPTLLLYIGLVAIGWINIYAVDYYIALSQKSWMAISPSAMKQLVWIFLSVFIFFLIFSIKKKYYEYFSYSIYLLSIALLIGTFFLGKNISGHHAWYQIGSIKFQPAEFAKMACALIIAQYISKKNTKLTQFRCQFYTGFLIFIPVLLILLQGDLGSSLVFSSLLIVLYKENFPKLIILIFFVICLIGILSLLVKTTLLIIGVGSIGVLLILFHKKTVKNMVLTISFTSCAIIFIQCINWIFQLFLKPYQKNRIISLIYPGNDPLGIGWNITQSKIAIGSGGLWGKGFLQGTQTKFNFVPEQRTDFIFCTIGEEYGWVGAYIVITMFVTLLCRIIYLAEKQRSKFSSIFGYSLASMLFFHFMINIGMTLGLMPIIGIPLPFISYGGSSLWTFSAMLFIFLKFDVENKKFL